MNPFYDVRPGSRVKPADQDVFGAAAQLYSSVAWGYPGLGGLSAVYLANLRRLAGNRHPSPRPLRRGG